MTGFDFKQVQTEITALMLAYPQLEADEVLRADMIEGSTGMDDFIRELLRKIGTTETLRDATGNYIEELKMRRARMEHTAEALRTLIFKIMQHAQIQKRVLPEATVSIRNTPAKVVVIDEQQIPDHYMRIKKEPDKIKIKTDLQANMSIAGVTLSNGEPTLAILTK